MKAMVLALAAIALMAAQSGGGLDGLRSSKPNSAELMDAVTQVANQSALTWDLEKAEPLLEEALQVSTHLGPERQAAAHLNLVKHPQAGLPRPTGTAA